MSDDRPLYNSRILRVYLEYLAVEHPNLDVAELLREAGLRLHQVADAGHWFTQRDVNAFHAVAARHTRDPDIARNAGLFIPRSKALSGIGQHALGLMSLHALYGIMGRFYVQVSRGAVITTRRLGPTAVELTSTPAPGVDEQPFQCANRAGSFVALAGLLTDGSAELNETTCLHKGGDACRYTIRWPAQASLRLTRWRNRIGFGAPLVAAAAGLSLPVAVAGHVVAAVAIVWLTAAWLASRARAAELARMIAKQGEEGRQLADELNSRYENAQLVMEIGQATAGVLETGDLARIVLSALERHTPYERGLVMLLTPGESQLALAGSYGFDPQTMAQLRHLRFAPSAPELGMIGRAFLERDVAVWQTQRREGADAKAELDSLAQLLGLQASICTPVHYQDRAIGVVLVDTRAPAVTATQSGINMLKGVASQLAISVTNIEAWRALREREQEVSSLERDAQTLQVAAHTDGLTGVANRRRFDETLTAELSRARRFDTPLSVVMLDLDHFKQVNDTWGHHVGDVVLMRIARELVEDARAYDLIARYGGEEFVGLLPRTGPDEARLVAERFRNRIARAAIAADGQTLRVTASFGVATFPGPEIADGVSLMKCADLALYRAKQAGRNCVV